VLRYPESTRSTHKPNLQSSSSVVLSSDKVKHLDSAMIVVISATFTATATLLCCYSYSLAAKIGEDPVGYGARAAGQLLLPEIVRCAKP
jgi:hypothetical protein